MQSLDKHPPPPIGPDHQIAAPVEAPPRHRRILHIALWLLLLLILALVGFLIWRHHENAEKAATAAANRPPPGINITITTANKGSIGVYLDSIGTVTPVYTASITAEVTGLIVAVHYTEGQTVKKGDPLVDI